MIDQVIANCNTKMDKSVDHTREQLAVIRSGKATPNMLNGIMVEYYGTQTPLNQIAGVSAPEARLLAVIPFDKSALADIEKAIISSDLGLNPNNDGSMIRIPIPVLTTDRREDLVKLARKYVEDGRISIRGIRREANDQLKKAEKDKEISEDESHRAADLVQKDTDKYIASLDELLKKRESEIREV
jgi:ribosome recycling factor